jgi:hypothetical protein
MQNYLPEVNDMIVNKPLKIFKPTEASLTNKVHRITFLEIKSINTMIMYGGRCEEIRIIKTIPVFRPKKVQQIKQLHWDHITSAQKSVGSNKILCTYPHLCLLMMMCHWNYLC